MDDSSGTVVKDLHQDLVRKYKIHSSNVESYWRSFTTAQRAKCLKAGAADGVVLKHSMDVSLGSVYKFIPEINLRDISASPDFLLDMLKHRAQKSLFEQYRVGVNNGPGDLAFIRDMMERRNLQHVNSFKDCYTFFIDDNYGQSVQLVSHQKQTLAEFKPALDAGLCIPQSTGELILQRQIYLLQTLNILVEDILEEGSSSRAKKQPAKKTKMATSERLAPEAPKIPVTIPDLIVASGEQSDSQQEYLDLLTQEPVVLASATNFHFFSRPELVPDERGRVLPVHTDKYISSAFFEAINEAVKGAAIWKYISSLVNLLKEADKQHRAIIAQELSNVCHLEYTRAQWLFKRHVQTGRGLKQFKRNSNAKDSTGNPQVKLKVKPEEFTRSDPQLHYMLRLCQPDTTANSAIEWLKKLGDLHQSHASEYENLSDREASALSDLAAVVVFIQDLSQAIALPPFTRKKRQLFNTKLQELEVELSQLKSQVDLQDFVAPIDHLLEPNMADNALKTLDQFIVDKTGAKLGFLYQDLHDYCLMDIQRQHQDEPSPEVVADVMEWLSTTDERPAKVVEHRRKKQKTRPTQRSNYDISERETIPQKPSSQTFTVTSSTFNTFSTLFKKSESRGSVNWTSFEGAMTELGFSVLPKFGSVYTFDPPQSMQIQRSVTIHRPHKARIEGYRILIIARRLERVYGWSEKTFKAK